MKKFEYQVLEVEATGFWGGKIESQELVIKLNELGAEGWELTSSFSTNKYEGQSRAAILILKRETV
jgi:hypothetical protein